MGSDVRVGIDVAPLVLDNAGTARYVRAIAGALEARGDVELERLTWGGPGRITAAVRDVAWYPLALPYVRARRLDVLHCTTFRAPLRAPLPVVVTVHDLAAVRHPELFTAWTRLYARTLLLPVLRAASAVVTVSAFTKREVIELAGVQDERIHVAPNAAGEPFGLNGPAVEGDYVLAVGTLEPRKNLQRLAEATRRLGLELRVAGAVGWGSVELDAPHVRWLGRPDDEELASLYRGALCLAYPSLYEGFGIPVLEAMRCGCPVVTSAGSAMEEVAGSAAELVDPDDEESIAAGIERALARRDELRAAGLERAARFSWTASADAVVGAYRAALS